MIRVQQEDFDHCEEYQRLREKADCDGAIVTFTGLVRDLNDNESVSGMQIEHYPGMTQKSLMHICTEARNRWELGQISIIHRVGYLEPAEQIVFVGVTSTHRKNAFESAQFIMDYLKNSAPFWKKEITSNGSQWVESKISDKQALQSWL